MAANMKMALRQLPGFAKGLSGLCRGGDWTARDPKYGGQGMPGALNVLMEEMGSLGQCVFRYLRGLDPGCLSRHQHLCQRRTQGTLSAKNGQRHLVGDDSRLNLNAVLISA